MANYNKNKGKSCEREIANELKEVFGLSFTRVPNSGAFVGGKNFWRAKQLSKEQNLLMDGDIIMPIELAHIKIEAKFYKDFSWVSTFDNNETLNKWIAQAKGQDDKIWFLIMKFNNVGKFVVYSNNLKFVIPGNNFLTYKGLYTVCSYDNFFETNKQQILDLKLPQNNVIIQSVLQPTV